MQQPMTTQAWRFRPRVWTPEKVADLQRLTAAGLPHHAQASRLGVSNQALRVYKRKHGIDRPTENLLTQLEVTRLLGIEHRGGETKVSRWIHQGLIPGGKPSEGYRILLKNLRTFLLNPDYWHLWDLDRVRDPDLQRRLRAIRGDVRYLSVADLEARFHVSATTIHRAIAAGRIPARKDGTHWRIKETDARPERLEVRPHNAKLIRSYFSREMDRELLGMLDRLAAKWDLPAATIANRATRIYRGMVHGYTRRPRG